MLLALGAALVVPLASAAEVVDCSLVAGWKQQGPLRHFTADNLYEYMDGAAEGYLAFGFNELRGATCESGESVLEINVSEMTDADAAYGIFSADRDSRQPVKKIGMGGQILPARGTFAKGKYYVEITATSDTPSMAALGAYINAIANRVEGQSTLPGTLACFPPQNLTSARLIPESVLGISLLKRGYVAQYDQGVAFLVLETTSESAAAVMANLAQRFPAAHPGHTADQALLLQDKYLGGVCFFRKRKWIGGYAHMPDEASAAAASVALAARVP